MQKDAGGGGNTETAFKFQNTFVISYVHEPDRFILLDPVLCERR